MKKPAETYETGKKSFGKSPVEPSSSVDQKENPNPVKSIAEITKEMAIKGILENAKLSKDNESLVTSKDSGSNKQNP